MNKLLRFIVLFAFSVLASVEAWALGADSMLTDSSKYVISGAIADSSNSVMPDAVADSIIALNKKTHYSTDNDSLKDSTLLAPLGERGWGKGTAPYYYDWKRDLTFVGIPVFISSFIIKANKTGFRSARNSFQKNFKTEIDNYVQYLPYVAVLGCKVAGYKGRSKWGRFLVSTAFSNIMMATFVNSVKYSVKEMRPDNSSHNSFPSGHTATAFTAATILHKEYGLTRSPWFSIGGYAVATATGVMRVLNNRHWISDVVAGAGIGIMSTELGYFAADLIFRHKGIDRYELDTEANPNHPSFFDIQMGVGMHTSSIEFTYDDASVPDDKIKLGTSTVFGVEMAHFINKYIGFGCMARITSTPAKGLNLDDNDKMKVNKLNQALASFNDADGNPLPGIYSMYIDNNNFNNASLDAGVYFNLPISRHFAAGAKALLGCRLGSGISYKAKNGTPKVDDTYTITDTEGKTYPIYWFEGSAGDEPFRSNTLLDPDVTNDYNYVLNNETAEYEFMNVKGKSCLNYVLGLSFTYRYKSNFAWKIFFDFDSARDRYTYQGTYFSDEALARIGKSAFPTAYPDTWNAINHSFLGHAEKTINLFSIGGCFTVRF